jgi:hypothetical protein
MTEIHKKFVEIHIYYFLIFLKSNFLNNFFFANIARDFRPYVQKLLIVNELDLLFEQFYDQEFQDFAKLILYLMSN